MSRYTNVRVNLSEGQKSEIKKAIESGAVVSIRFSHEDLSTTSGENVLALTQTQINKMTKAYQNGTGTTINMSKSQLKHNMKVEGGFLPALFAMAPLLLKAAIPAVATGALSGLASTAVSKALGSALYVKRGQYGFKVVPAGKGLFLSPWKKSSSVTASGLYMKKGSGAYVNGEGLLLGPDSPFKNIPILGLIL
jgi:hypothetical protein